MKISFLIRFLNQKIIKPQFPSSSIHRFFITFSPCCINHNELIFYTIFNDFPHFSTARKTQQNNITNKYHYCTLINYLIFNVSSQLNGAEFDERSFHLVDLWNVCCFFCWCHFCAKKKMLKRNFVYINDFLAFQIGHGKVGEAFFCCDSA